jgi:DNA invertase Pin-like site-specific DNA recombinase
MKCISYSRVSSIGQNEYNKSVSLHAQEEICGYFAHENKLKIKAIYKEVHSAYNKIPNILNNIVNKKKQTILLSSIDRFSRSVSIGTELALKAINNKNTLIFIQEKLVISTIDGVSILKPHLLKSESESTLLSNRIKKSKTYLINNGMFPGGAIPYGYELINKRLVENSYEQKVILFIKLCKKKCINCIDLNTNMMCISKLDKYVDINCYDEKDTIIIQLTECLNNSEIVNLLLT